MIFKIGDKVERIINSADNTSKVQKGSRHIIKEVIGEGSGALLVLEDYPEYTWCSAFFVPVEQYFGRKAHKMPKQPRKMSAMLWERQLDKNREKFVRETLRRASFRWPPRGAALRAARTVQKPNPATGRLCWHVTCAGCKLEFMEREVKLDHIEPVVPLNNHDMSSMRNKSHTVGGGALDLGSFVLRMFPATTGFQVLCKQCHDTKTKEESSARAEFKRAAKGLESTRDKG